MNKHTSSLSSHYQSLNHKKSLINIFTASLQGSQVIKSKRYMHFFQQEKYSFLTYKLSFSSMPKNSIIALLSNFTVTVEVLDPKPPPLKFPTDKHALSGKDTSIFTPSIYHFLNPKTSSSMCFCSINIVLSVQSFI